MPLYVRAGAILPLGPVKQYTSEKVDGPLSVTIYPGADGSFLLYEDDGRSFNCRKGDWMGIKMAWSDSRRVLSLHVASRAAANRSEAGASDTAHCVRRSSDSDRVLAV